MHDRENAFEAKFAHDEEFRFLVDARRDKLFAHWAAATAGITGAAEDSLVSDVLGIANGPDHDAAVARHIRGVLAGRGIDVADADLVEALDRCSKQAFAQLSADPPHQSEIV
jgi:hypothetical protein